MVALPERVTRATAITLEVIRMEVDAGGSVGTTCHHCLAQPTTRVSVKALMVRTTVRLTGAWTLVWYRRRLNDRHCRSWDRRKRKFPRRQSLTPVPVGTSMSLLTRLARVIVSSKRAARDHSAGSNGVLAPTRTANARLPIRAQICSAGPATTLRTKTSARVTIAQRTSAGNGMASSSYAGEQPDRCQTNTTCTRDFCWGLYNKTEAGDGSFKEL